MKRRIAPIDTWPEIRITFLPLPWTWRQLRAYADDDGWLSHSSIQFGPFQIEIWGQKGGWRDQFTVVEENPL